MQVLTWIAGTALAIVVVGVLVGLIPPPTRVFADSTRIVSMYYDGQKKVITTEAPTVGSALQEAGVTLGQGDLVEPSADTPIPTGFYNINVYRSRPVTVIDGDTRKIIQTALQSSSLIAKQAGFTVYPEDTYSTAIINDITDAGTIGQSLTINRATSAVISADGQQYTVRSQQSTVGGLLDERDMAFGPQDTVTPSRETPLTANMTIQVNRVKIVVVDETQPIAHEVETQKDAELEAGTTKVVTAGEDGKKEMTYRIHFQNGAEYSRELLDESVVKPPKTEVRVVGTKPKNLYGYGVWDRLAFCESGGRWDYNGGSGFDGGLQFLPSTWNGLNTGYSYAWQAPREVQIEAGIRLQARSGWKQWPVCGRQLGLF